MHKRAGTVMAMVVAGGVCAGAVWASQGLAGFVRQPWLSWASVAARAVSDDRPGADASEQTPSFWVRTTPRPRVQAGASPEPRAWAGAAPAAGARAALGGAPMPMPMPMAAASPSSSYSTSAPQYMTDPAAAAVESIAVGDVSGDGWDDLVFLSVRHAPNPANSRTEVYVAYQGADGRLAPAVKIADAGSQFETQLLIADLDRDGIGDIVTTALTSVLVLRPNGRGQFFGSMTPVGSYPGDLVVTDVDRDGYLDVLVDSSNTSATVVHGGPDSFARTSTLPLLASAERTVGDVTGDGLDDLILGTIFNRPLEEFRVYPALASGGYGAPMVLSLPLGSNHTGSLAVGDFNGDGRGDLALEEVRDGANLHLFLQDAQGKLVPAPDLVRQRGYGSLLASDLDRDGYTDIAIAHVGWGYVGYYLQTPTGFTAENVIDARQFSARVNFFATGDLNHDGCGDLVAGRGSQSPVLMYGQGCSPGPVADCRYPESAMPDPVLAAPSAASPVVSQRGGDAAPGPARSGDVRFGREGQGGRGVSRPDRVGVRMLDR